MYRITNIKIAIDVKQDLRREASKKMKVKPSQIKSLDIIKKSVDARKGSIHFVYTVDVSLSDGVERKAERLKDVREVTKPIMKAVPQFTVKNKEIRVVVVGTGPAGLFCALTLARSGMKPLVIERGSEMTKREQTVDAFWATGELNEQTNVQFGEGGAGTFSDGKLNSNIKNPLCQAVLHEYVRAGAPKEIIYLNKPHVGTNYIRCAVVAMRQEIIGLGGEFKFNACMTDIEAINDEVKSITINHKEFIPCDKLVLAIGHSARDTYAMLKDKGVAMQRKTFSVGARIEHPQTIIDTNQYGKWAGHKALSAADYRLVYHDASGRSAYSFCMCPGGYVVASSSEKGGVVTNGMSYHDRSADNANSALLVNVYPDDLQGKDVLEGIRFQRELEKKAFAMSGENYAAPMQTVGNFLGKITENMIGEVQPTYSCGVTSCDLHDILPQYITDTLKAGIQAFDKKIQGFAREDAILTGVETRSSAPITLLRGDDFQSVNIKNLYPIGEGAGHAGGIMSSAVDGIRCAERVVE